MFLEKYVSLFSLIFLTTMHIIRCFFVVALCFYESSVNLYLNILMFYVCTVKYYGILYMQLSFILNEKNFNKFTVNTCFRADVPPTGKLWA